MYKILSINPGSTSTKIAVYADEQLQFLYTIRHPKETLDQFAHVFDEYEFRENVILEKLKADGIELNFDAIIGRGGLMRPLESGVYEVNGKMINDLKQASQHASNLGAVLAQEIAKRISNCKAYIADPVVVDELQDVARVSGLPQFPRRSVFHALNHKAIARKYALAIGKTYEQLNLIIVHLGGGISVAAHQHGRVIDTNQALDGYGAFSPERAGTVDAGLLVKLCFSKEWSEEEILKMLAGKGGMVAHLGTNDMQEIYENVQQGDEHAKLIFEAMAYQVGKEIGSMLAVLKGEVDAVLLTGGIAHSQFFVQQVKEMVDPIAHVVVYPGEDEMEALAMSALRVLRQEEASKLY